MLIMTHFEIKTQRLEPLMSRGDLRRHSWTQTPTPLTPSLMPNPDTIRRLREETTLFFIRKQATCIRRH